MCVFFGRIQYRPLWVGVQNVFEFRANDRPETAWYGETSHHVSLFYIKTNGNGYTHKVYSHNKKNNYVARFIYRNKATVYTC